MVHRAEVGKPLQAWGDPLSRVEAGVDPSNQFITNTLVSDRKRRCSPTSRSEPAFYDQEALEEKLRDKKIEISTLLEEETDLQQRLASARATLAAMRAKKRHLSTANTLSDEGAVNAVRRRSTNRWESPLSGRRRYREDGEEGDHGERKNSSINMEFAAKDRIMELELLNSHLRRGQAKADSEARSGEAASRATKAELEQARERLHAMPKRFTDSLGLLRDEVEKMEKEKLALELASQERSFKEAGILMSCNRRLEYMTTELESVLGEINDVEDGRDQWKRRLRVESARIASFQSQRREALEDLRVRFGEDAVERAAFTTAACRAGKSLLDDHRDGDVEQGDCCGVPLSDVAEALRPVYAVDGLVVTTETVAEAAQECGVDFPGIKKEERIVGLEEFCVLANQLRRKGKRVFVDNFESGLSSDHPCRE